MLFPSLGLIASGGATFTDYLTGWGSISLAAATFITLGVTIYFATAERRRAHTERDERQLAQARMIITNGPNTMYPYVLIFQFANHGDRPVLGIVVEVWVGADPLDGPSERYENYSIVMAGENKECKISTITSDAESTLRAWRIRWTGADGHQWCVDQARQPEPLPFTGQMPRRYVGVASP